MLLYGSHDATPHSQRTKEKSLDESRLYECLARLAGIEPTTPWFVAKYSNPTELQPLSFKL